MTRRIAFAILLTVWAMLVGAGAVAYWTTRGVLLEDLDHTLTQRALALPGLARESDGGTAELAPVQPGDQFIIKNAYNQTIARPAASAQAAGEPRPIAAAFSYADGRRVRSVTVRALAPSPTDDGGCVPVTVTYRGSAERFDRLLNRLLVALVVAGAIGGLVAAGVAVRVSRVALRPLEATAKQIGGIDEQRLDRRIDERSLPPELQPMARRLNELLRRLEQAFAVRTQFIADASHELRTPVAALATALEVALRRPRTADAYRQILVTCHTEALGLRRLVERLMEQVRAQELTHDEPLQSVDVARLLHECADCVAPLAEEKHVRLQRVIPDSATMAMRPTRLRSIATNLLSNAIEYNRPDGLVELTCELANGRFILTVRDTGIGIAPENLQQLFEPFFRVEASRAQAGTHLGLGLSLVKSHVQSMGGTCQVSSELGSGTTFRVELPQQPETPACGAELVDGTSQATALSSNAVN